ncbi:MAG TPA: DUF2098 domain-containing protein [Methanocorpusculum sp.]|nr:DUF2098 domain-containing protein [Methanocorpusculum sp.]
MRTFEVGETVRYSRTGTVGKIVSFMEETGATFAELDSTGLYYRTDQLIAINDVVQSKEKTRDFKKDFKEEQDKLREVQRNAWQDTDQSYGGVG